MQKSRKKKKIISMLRSVHNAVFSNFHNRDIFLNECNNLKVNIYNMSDRYKKHGCVVIVI